MPTITGLAAVGVLALLLTIGASAALPAPVAWVEPSMERVGPFDSAGTASEIDLYAAQGETESFQIIVRAAGENLTNVDVTAPDLGGPEVTLYREHYVYLSTGSGDWASNRNRPEGPGWYPDPLIPFDDPATGQDLVGAQLDAVPFDLAADRNQPIWVDVYVPRGTAPGQYSGSFTVTSGQGQASATLNLTVWDFAVPLRPSADSSILLWTMRRDLATARELLQHRLMPSSVNRGDESYLISSYGLGATGLGFWSGADGTNCLMRSPPSVAELQAAAAEHEPELKLYNYTADEIDSCTNLYETLRSWARNLHAAGVDNLVTMAPVPELYDDGSGTGRSAVDIWVILPKMYDNASDRVIYCQQKGDEVWSYNCLMQDDYSPKWAIDFSPINYRIQPGFINQSLGMTGVLYWRADLWSTDPWNNVEAYAPWYPGEGMLVYPGQQVGVPGVVASMRVKWLRDGIDDYDYVHMLEQLGLGDQALEIARTVGPDWSDWTRDPAELEAARRQLGEMLSSLGGASHGIVARGQSDPRDVGSTGTTSLSATAVDGEGHAITSWHWSDGGAGGSFAPSADVQGPEYQAPVNMTEFDLIVHLTVTAGCGEAVGSHTIELRVRPREGAFYDVPDDHWAHAAINACLDAGIVRGFPDGFYRPGRSVTRAEMAVYIARALTGSDAAVPELTGPTRFPDIPADYWAAKHIEYAAGARIVGGYPDGMYHGDWTITRGQMSVFIARSMVDPTGEEGLADYVPPSTPTFPDVQTYFWAYAHIEYLVEHGGGSGYPDGLYRPTATCTRDQMAVYIARAFGLLEQP
jgi:hypothetical protein